jgi:hypothetical protein
LHSDFHATGGSHPENLHVAHHNIITEMSRILIIA